MSAARLLEKVNMWSLDFYKYYQIHGVVIVSRKPTIHELRNDRDTTSLTILV